MKNIVKNYGLILGYVLVIIFNCLLAFEFSSKGFYQLLIINLIVHLIAIPILSYIVSFNCFSLNKSWRFIIGAIIHLLYLGIPLLVTLIQTNFADLHNPKSIGVLIELVKAELIIPALCGIVYIFVK